MLDRDKLPDSSTELKGIVYHLLDMLEEQKRLIANQNKRIDSQFQKIEEQSKRIDHLTDQVNSLKRHRYGKKSEKLPDEDPPEENGSGGSSGQPSVSPDGYLRVSFHPFPERPPYVSSTHESWLHTFRGYV